MPLPCYQQNQPRAQRSVPTWVVVAILASLALIAVIFVLWQGLAAVLSPSGFAQRKDALQLLAQIAGGILALAVVILTWWRISVAEKNVQLAQEGQITERFTRAIEQLGNRDSLEVRLGGIYALERIARDSEKDHWPIMEVLTAFVRERAPWSEASPCPANPPRADIQAILTVLGRRDRSHERPPDHRLDLRKTDLRGVNLVVAGNRADPDPKGAHLEWADLEATNLEKKAQLIGIHLEDARLMAVRFQGADLRNAHLERARLKGADLRAANLRQASLWHTHLEGADLSGANLSGAQGLTQKQLDQARGDKRTTLPEAPDPDTGRPLVRPSHWVTEDEAE